MLNPWLLLGFRAFSLESRPKASLHLAKRFLDMTLSFLTLPKQIFCQSEHCVRACQTWIEGERSLAFHYSASGPSGGNEDRSHQTMRPRVLPPRDSHQ
jgi:hypothetical protein